MKASDRTSSLSVSALHAVARSGLAAKAFELGFLPLCLLPLCYRFLLTYIHGRHQSFDGNYYYYYYYYYYYHYYYYYYYYYYYCF